MKFRLGEIFCGPGGLALGAQMAKVRNYEIVHEWATDYDHDSCETYRHNICPKRPESVIRKDIRNLNLKQFPPIDILAFGFPCNDFSVVGEQKGINGIYGPLYSYGIEALTIFRPKVFFAENVGGLRNSNDGNTLYQILYELQSAGYNIVPHLYKFELYGVPQARHRIIIIGIRHDLNIKYLVPAPTHSAPITCRYALENPPIPMNAPNNELTKQSHQVIERLKYIKPGENAFTASLPERLRLNVRGAKISQIYRRLDPQKPSYTITGSGGGGTHVYHWKENRALTNRERARLQSFPDSFIFCGSKESVRKQIGMAVPPMGAKVIFEAVMKSFAGIEYPSCKPNIKYIVNNSLMLFEKQESYVIVEEA